MFTMFKKLFTSAAPASVPQDDSEAEAIALALAELEQALSVNPADNATQKALMVKYNQAIKAYSARPNYRQRVDDVFVKMDELRNTIRKNI